MNWEAWMLVIMFVLVVLIAMSQVFGVNLISF